MGFLYACRADTMGCCNATLRKHVLDDFIVCTCSVKPEITLYELVITELGDRFEALQSQTLSASVQWIPTRNIVRMTRCHVQKERSAFLVLTESGERYIYDPEWAMKVGQESIVTRKR